MWMQARVRARTHYLSQNIFNFADHTEKTVLVLWSTGPVAAFLVHFLSPPTAFHPLSWGSLQTWWAAAAPNGKPCHPAGGRPGSPEEEKSSSSADPLGLTCSAVGRIGQTKQREKQTNQQLPQIMNTIPDRLTDNVRLTRALKASRTSGLLSLRRFSASSGNPTQIHNTEGRLHYADV